MTTSVSYRWEILRTAVYYPVQRGQCLIIFRQDWLDKLGLKYPETLDDMKNVLIAFTNNDPDGNGKNDTYGYTAEKPSSSSGVTPFDWVFFATAFRMRTIP